MMINEKKWYLESVSAEELLTIANKPFRVNCCFICKRKITNKNKSQEHVLPDWLIKYMNINKSNDTFTVGRNNQKVRYSANKLSCCLDCNSLLNEKIEKPISVVIKNGFDVFIEEYKKEDFAKKYDTWINLVYLKYYLSDLGRKKDLTKEFSSKLINNDEIQKKYQLIYLFILSTLLPEKFKFISDEDGLCHLANNCLVLDSEIFKSALKKNYQIRHYSNLFFKCKMAKDKSLNFNMRTNPNGLMLLQINDIGIISNLKDYGFLSSGNCRLMNWISLATKKKEIAGDQLLDVMAHANYEHSDFIHISCSYFPLIIHENTIILIQKKPRFIELKQRKFSKQDIGYYQGLALGHSSIIYGQHFHILFDANENFKDIDPDN